MANSKSKKGGGKRPLSRTQLAKQFPEDAAKRFLCTRGDEEKFALLSYRAGGSLPEPTVKEQVQEDIKVQRLQRALHDQKVRYNQLMKEYNDWIEYNEFWQEIESPISIPVYKARHKSSVDEAVAVLVASDWHLEENVRPCATNGFNEYNPEIAEERVRKMWRSAIRMIEKERQASKIDCLYLGLLGDFIAGYIHEELVESNFLPPQLAIELALRLIEEGLNYLVENGGFKEINVVTAYGNHARMTKKPRVSTAAVNNLEWGMYRRLAKDWVEKGGSDIVKFHLTDEYFNIHQVFDHTLRFHHGDHVPGGGGVGGVAVPAQRSVYKWNKNNPCPADFDVFGHFHSLTFLPDLMINGSLVGYNAYASKIKARYEVPQQGMFLVAKEHGPTCYNRIWCT